MLGTAEVPLSKVPKPLWVYIPPDANVKQGYVLAAINKQNSYSMVSSLLTETLLLKFDQQVKCATRGTKTLDQIHSNIKMDTGAPPVPCLLLTPVYSPFTGNQRPSPRTVTTGPDEKLGLGF